jgi:hypothetical protein
MKAIRIFTTFVKHSAQFAVFPLKFHLLHNIISLISKNIYGFLRSKNENLNTQPRKLQYTDKLFSFKA